MSTIPSASTSHSNFVSIFNAALETYKRNTKKDLASHPLLPILQFCNSPEMVLTVLREQIPTFSQSPNSDDGLTKWVTPTVNVLYSFSAALGGGFGLAFPSTNTVFAGIGILLLAVNDTTASQDMLIDLFNHIEHFFRRLEIYTDIIPTIAMTDIVVEIMVEVLRILAIATKEVKRGRFKTYMKKLIGNTDIEDSLERLDKLTQEEARMASVELLKITHSVDDRVKGVEGDIQDVHGNVQSVDVKVQGVDYRVQGVDNRVQGVNYGVQGVDYRVQGVDYRVQGVDSRVQGVDDKVQGVDSRVQGVDDKVRGVDDKVQGVDDKLDQANRNHLRDSLLRWLSPPDPSINHNIASKVHHSGTAQWFLQGGIFSRWKSTDPFLWIHGKPGSGKSVVCSSIIQDIMTLRDTGKASMAYFYFDFGDADKQKLHNLLPSLLIQLSARSDLCCDILSRLYFSHDRGVQIPSDRAMIDCLKEMLTLEAQGPTYIVLDALDECPITSTIPSPREEVLELVKELVGLHLPNVHICATSRPEHDIQGVLGHLTPHSVSLHDETGQQRDISNYVTSFVHSDRRMQRWPEEDKDLVIKILSEKADGMFRWVFCQLEVLRQCFPPSVRSILKELPESLDETYERILRGIRKPNQGYAHRLLQCLVAAVRPLRVAELAEVLTFDFKAEGTPKLSPGWRWEDQEEAVMSACSSLVIIVKDGDSQIVQFSHFSVKEFLTANRLADPIRDVSCYHIQLEAAHTILAQACLGILLRLDDCVDRDNIKDFPLARYAAQYWATHARFENTSSRIKDGMECLFDADKPHFAAWLWIYNEDRDGRSMSTKRPEKPGAVPLYYAAMLGFRDLAEHLIAEHTEHVNARGGSKETPMHIAAKAGHADILSLLLEHGADVDVKISCYYTPLHQASYYGKLEAGKCLLDRGADVNAQIFNDATPLCLVALGAHDCVEFARMLLIRGARINDHDKDLWTPLHRAIRTKNIQIVRLLLEHGADVNARDNSGETPSQLESARSTPRIAELLSKYGAKSVE